MLERLKVKRSDIPAVTHLDYSARLQTVNNKYKQEYHEIILTKDNILRTSNSTKSCNGALKVRNPILETLSTVYSKHNWIRATYKLFSGESIRKSIVALADQAVVSATNFLTVIIIARSCTKEELGLYTLGYTIVILVIGLQDGLISMPYTVYRHRLTGHAISQYMGSTLIHQLGFSIITIVLLLSAGVIITHGIGPQKLTPVIWALATSILFIQFKEFLRRLCLANLQIRIAFLVDFGVAVFQIGGLMLLSYMRVLSASLSYLVAGSACGLLVVSWLFWMRRSFSISLPRAITDLARNWFLGKWLFGSALLWLISMNLYPWFLAVFHGMEATGVFAVCTGVVNIATLFVYGMMNYLGPSMALIYAKGGNEELRRLVFKTLFVFGVLTGPFCILVFILGGQIVVMIYGNKYGGNGIIVSILTMNFLFWTIGIVVARALFAMERADTDFRLNIFTLIIMFSIGLWLTESFGPAGAAYGLLLGNATGAICRLLFFNAKTKSILRH